MGKASNSAATRKMIADERYTLKYSHLVVVRAFGGTVFARVSEVGICTSCGRPASIAPGEIDLRKLPGLFSAWQTTPLSTSQVEAKLEPSLTSVVGTRQRRYFMSTLN